jgi:fused signal recognition particle receptor
MPGGTWWEVKLASLNLFGKTEKAVKSTKEGWFGKVSHLFQRPSIDQSLWEELEETLISADVGVNTTLKLIGKVKERVKREKLDDGDQVYAALKDEMTKILKLATSTKASTELSISAPSVILVVGVNGSGKTTTIAKLAHRYKDEGKQVILSAADTFRAAAIDQLKVWGERVDVAVISHQPGADPGAVVFDSLQAMRSRGADMLIVDTAGRLHTKFNLMEELKKVRRIIARFNDLASQQVLLVLDATTGQNGLAQARYFAEAVGIDGLVLAKLDSTSKGGIVFAICDELNIPLLFIGTGETLDDLAPFDPQVFVEALFS